MTQMEKREYAAYTIRPKIRKLLPRYLNTPAGPSSAPKVQSAASEISY